MIDAGTDEILGAALLSIDAQVTLFERGPRLLPLHDDDVAAVAVEILLGDGVELVARARVLEVRDGESGATVVYEQGARRHSTRSM